MSEKVIKKIFEGMNIFQRMSEITNEIGFVSKGLNVQVTKNSSYKAVSEVDVLEAVKPLEKKYGVFSYPVETEIEEQMQITSTSQYGDRNNFYLRLKRKYRFLCVDNPQDYVDIISYGDGLDTGDKATGKAQTYADKYALMKAYKISTGDDPDKEASQEYTKSLATEKQVGLIKKLYTEAEIATMEKRMKKTVEQISVQEASKMIKARSGKNE